MTRYRGPSGSGGGGNKDKGPPASFSSSQSSSRSSNSNNKDKGRSSGGGEGQDQNNLNKGRVSRDEDTMSDRHHSSRGGRRRIPRGGDGGGGSWFKNVLYTTAFVIIVAFVTYYGYLGYLETRISTPLQVDKVVSKTGLDVSERFWGSYRPGVYFGMKHRSPRSLLTGLMWLQPKLVTPGHANLRHLCEQGDNLKRYGWIEHDGVNFGIQEIVDHDIKLTTSFVKTHSGRKGGHWTNQINAQPLKESPEISEPNFDNEIVLLYYVALEPGLQGKLVPQFNGDVLESVKGYTEELGNFKIKFKTDKPVLKSSFLVTSLDTMNAASQIVLSNMATTSVSGKWMFLFRNDPQINLNTQNFIVYQVHAKAPVRLEIIYESEEHNSGDMKPLSGSTYNEMLEQHSKRFNLKLESTFHLEHQGFNKTAIKFAKAALSNLVGGIGYFHGHSKVQSIYNSAPVPYWPANLYTAVPSRSFFPRGFLWDEGFHLLLINKWDPRISIDIIGHWLDLMNTEGWIPREMILGDEALSRVPDEFVVQRNNVANPPTLLMALYDLLTRHREWLLLNHKDTLLRMWPRLSTWYQWLNRTQAGEVPFTYRWRGRNDSAIFEMNPKTLASGLDDYPRASHPTDEERHLDLRCWMALSSKLMGELADVLGYDGAKFHYSYEKLTDLQLLDKLHWSAELEAYSDYGLNSPKVVLQRPPSPRNSGGQPPVQPQKIRHTVVPPEPGFVNAFGYVSLFPLIMEILEPDSPPFTATLNKLSDPKILWTNYGLRSLAANAPLYNKYNTEHDPPYWRGPIWINVNFLTLKSLHSYSATSKLAQAKYKELRENVINNVMSQYYKTGYVWEQYDDSTGKGKGCRPFTGWSALVVLVMAEEY